MSTEVSATLPISYAVCIGLQEWKLRESSGYWVTHYGELSNLQQMRPTEVIIPIDPWSAVMEGYITWDDLNINDGAKALFKLLATDEEKTDGN